VLENVESGSFAFALFVQLPLNRHTVYIQLPLDRYKVLVQLPPNRHKVRLSNFHRHTQRIALFTYVAQDRSDSADRLAFLTKLDPVLFTKSDSTLVKVPLKVSLLANPIDPNQLIQLIRRFDCRQSSLRTRLLLRTSVRCSPHSPV